MQPILQPHQFIDDMDTMDEKTPENSEKNPEKDKQATLL